MAKRKTRLGRGLPKPIKRTEFNLEWPEKWEKALEALASAASIEVPDPYHITLNVRPSYSADGAAGLLADLRAFRAELNLVVRSMEMLGPEPIGQLCRTIDAAITLSANWVDRDLTEYLAENWLIGYESKERLRKNRELSAKKRSSNARAWQEKVQREAEQIWRSNPAQRTEAVAGRIIKNLKIDKKTKTVADVIRHLKPTRS